MSYRPFAVTVVAATMVSASFRRLRLAGAGLAELEWAGVDQRVKLVLAGADLLEALTIEPGDGWYATWCALPEGVRPPMRTYTIAAHRPDQCEIDIDVAVHGEAGPLSRFAQRARPGDRLLLVAPGRGGAAAGGVAWRPGGARHVLCVGDETALPAIRNIVATLDAGQACWVVLEVPTKTTGSPCPPPRASASTGRCAHRGRRWVPRRTASCSAGRAVRPPPASRTPTCGRRPPGTTTTATPGWPARSAG